jgi:M6 family metalloprotease-like protein
MASSTVAIGFADIVGIAYSSSRKVAVVAERSGRLTLLDLLREEDGLYESRVIGTGYDQPTHVAVDGTNSRVIVADADGLWQAKLSNANRAAATAFATQPDGVRSLGVLAGAGAASGLAVLDGPTPRLRRFSLGDQPGTSVTDLLPGLVGALDAALTLDGTAAHILTSVSGVLTLQHGDFALGTVVPVFQPLPFGGRVAAMSRGWALIAGPSGQLAAVGAGGVRVVAGTTVLPSAGRPVAAIEDERALLAAGGEILEISLPIGITDPVLLTVEHGPMFVGGYAPVRIDTTGSGLSFDDLVLSTDDVDFGAMSPSKDDTFDPGRPHLLLAGGWKKGPSKVVARNASTGEVVGRAAFEIIDGWDKRDEGPTFSITGKVNAPIVRPAWGGGGAGPQNVDVFKAPAQWRVAIVMIDTTSNTFPTVAAQLNPIVNDWRNAMTAGVAVGGVNTSVTEYYKEVSYGKLSMSLVGNSIAGPVHAPGSWDTYFEVETEPDPANPGMTRPRRWNPKPDAWKAMVSAIEQANADAAAATPPRPALVDFSKTDAIAFVIRTVNMPDPAVVPATATSIGRYVWPQQSTQTIKLNGSDRTLPMLFMPENWTAIDGRQIHETLAHEIGHSLQLPDLYLYQWMNQGLAQRQLNDWDLMHRDAGLPGLSLANRMALGWIPAAEVKTFNFAANGGGAVLEPVTLHAIGATPLPAGQFRGVEVRVANGRNYYFEYRNRQGASLADSSLPMGQVVMGVDVSSPKGGQVYDSRPMIMRLRDDPDARDDTDSILTEGAFLGAGDDYREQDFSDGAPKDFVATVLEVHADRAVLQIRYNSEARPELSIRTWPNGDKQWQSPDIEVRNAKSDADAKWLNVPWGGNPNRVVAKVTNRGGLPARDVRAHFSIKNLTTNADDQPPAQLEPLDVSNPVTIPAGQTRELEIAWVAPTSGHYCITVDLPLYEEPGNPAIHESSDRDNFAQSNYDKFWSESGSPSTRKRFKVKLENPTSSPSIVFPRIRQTSPFYRVFLEHSWLRLGPHQTRDIEVMVESLVNDPLWEDFVSQHEGEVFEVPNILEISGWVQGVCAPQCTGGATVETRSGVASQFEGLEFSPEPGGLGVVRTSHGDAVDNGTVLMTAYREGDDPSQQLTATDEVSNDGRFFAFMQGLEEGMLAQFFYLGGFGFAPCESRPRRVTF